MGPFSPISATKLALFPLTFKILDSIPYFANKSLIYLATLTSSSFTDGISTISANTLILSISFITITSPLTQIINLDFQPNQRTYFNFFVK